MCKYGGADRALPSNPPPRPGIKEPLVPVPCDGHLHKTIKQLIVFLKDKNESGDVIPKEVLFVLPGLIILLVSIQ